MTDKNRGNSRAAIVLQSGGGRRYALGPMESIFKADGDETGERYSISEWRLEPHQAGPGAHSHEENDDIFYVLEGPVTILVGDEHIDAEKGAFVFVPAGVTHDFENRSDHRVGLLNFYIPGGFEKDMPAIVEWYRKQGGNAPD